MYRFSFWFSILMMEFLKKPTIISISLYSISILIFFSIANSFTRKLHSITIQFSFAVFFF